MVANLLSSVTVTVTDTLPQPLQTQTRASPLLPVADDEIRLICRSLTGVTFSTVVDKTSCVSNLIQQIYDREGIPPEQIRLVFKGKNLDPSCSFEDYNITNESVIHYILRLVGGKPVIYLTSPSKVDAVVTLSLIYEWKFTAVYPVVPVKPSKGFSGEQIQWKVSTHPNGSLTETTTGLDVSYLFWEASGDKTNPLSPPPTSIFDSTGASVEHFSPLQSDLSDDNSVLLAVENITFYLDKTLHALGLHTEARTSFITYWLPSLHRHTHVALRFLPQRAYEHAAPLDIVPQPDVITRVFMLFKGVKETQLDAWPQAKALAVSGFDTWNNVVGVDVGRMNDVNLYRVLEWGGMEVVSM